MASYLSPATAPAGTAASIAASSAALSVDELAAIEAAVPDGAVAGDRYDAAQMAALDSER